MSKIIDPVTGREVKTNPKWDDISGRRWNQITYSANHGIPFNEINPPLKAEEIELYESISEDLIDYRKKYGDGFMFDDAVELEW